MFSKEKTQKKYTQENLLELTNTILKFAKQGIARELFAMKQQYKDSVNLSAGYCQTCSHSSCTRP